ncbi:TetR/AcrR family transcriptional regulator [Nonomuraea sp. C10]|uniref:TetR/AcrR family transcriptional regulator n=1 Tax=Nonomuraea sp. C10 TaxID=2600577 RepID=UPI0011CD699B|nr:TetR/AcrR family transcriptional regulator [Nonomuraea sp. C10]TXK35507.1 TetR/AcrR family transcriptional regulator [Nonomuraea sp. C10]
MVDDTRKRLIESALSLLREEGLDAVTLRAVGELAGLSRMAPYRHFTDKTALLAALAARVITDLSTHVAAAVLRHAGRQERLRAFYGSYVEYAVAHREEYRLVFASAFSAGDHPEMEKALDEVMTALSLDITDHGPVNKATMMALMSTAHGLAELATAGHFAHKAIRLQDIIDVIIKGVGRAGEDAAGQPGATRR